MDLRNHKIFKRVRETIRPETDGTGENNQPLDQVDSQDYESKAKGILSKGKYLVKKGYYFGKNSIKNIKDDILGTNIFSKYQPSKCKVKAHPLFTGGGYNYFRKLILLFTLFCPAMLFVFPQVFNAFIAQYLFDSATSLEPAKRKNQKDIPLSHRQKRKLVQLKQQEAKNKLEQNIRKSKRKRKLSKRKQLLEHNQSTIQTAQSNVSNVSFDASLC